MRIRPAALAATLVALAACSSDSTAPKPVATAVELTPSTVAATATVNHALAATPTFVVKDQNGKVMAGVPVVVAVTAGGGSVQGAPTVTGSAPISVGQWTLGHAAGANTLTVTAGSLTPVTIDAVATADAPAQLTVLSGDQQTALAGSALPVQPTVVVRDQFGNPVGGQVATFAANAGGGSVSASTATTGADGSAATGWTLGRSAVAQQLTAAVGALRATMNAQVKTNYTIDVRFYGSPMSAAQQALFTTAAARIRGAVVGQLSTVDLTGAQPDSDCGAVGVAPLAESTDGVIIYASVQHIDGPGKILAQAGPCYFRGQNDVRTLVGVMEFDVDDLASLGTGQVLQDVITHEMLHIVGVGTYWNYKGLLTGYNTPTVAYTGANGLSGCLATGGSTTCATSVPVENQGGSGTANSHWREATFKSELMTGYAENGPMPLSAMTIGSLTDLGYTVNLASADPYTIFIGSQQAGGVSASVAGAPKLALNWEGTRAFRPIAIAQARENARLRAAARSAQ